MVYSCYGIYSAIKGNEELIYAITWMNAENMMLSERSQSSRPYFVWFHLYEMYRIGKSIETESRSVFALGLRGWEKIEVVTAKGYSFFLVWWKCSKNCLWWLHSSVNMLKNNELYTLNLWIVWYMNYILSCYPPHFKKIKNLMQWLSIAATHRITQLIL